MIEPYTCMYTLILITCISYTAVVIDCRFSAAALSDRRRTCLSVLAMRNVPLGGGRVKRAMTVGTLLVVGVLGDGRRRQVGDITATLLGVSDGLGVANCLDEVLVLGSPVLFLKHQQWMDVSS